MKSIIKKIIIRILPCSIKKIIEFEIGKRTEDILRNSNLSYSQEGEDMILARIFGEKKNGFYIDVGAHHPTRFSNTYLFYLKGWRGINIDAMPLSMKEFEKVRPEDINIEYPISDKEEVIKYYIFNEPALNTFSRSESQKKNHLNGYEIIEEKLLRTSTLADILSKHLKRGQQIDFLSIDVEGFDLKVLQSIDWTKCKPTVILVEDLTNDLEAVLESGSIRKYLQPLGYKIFAKTINTLFFHLEK